MVYLQLSIACLCTAAACGAASGKDAAQSQSTRKVTDGGIVHIFSSSRSHQKARGTPRRKAKASGGGGAPRRHFCVCEKQPGTFIARSRYWSSGHGRIMPVEAVAAGAPQEGYDPFEVLRNANTVLLHNLRRDEVSPELQKQLTTTGIAQSSQAYFCDPYTNSYLGPQVWIAPREPQTQYF